MQEARGSRRAVASGRAVFLAADELATPAAPGGVARHARTPSRAGAATGRPPRETTRSGEPSAPAAAPAGGDDHHAQKTGVDGLHECCGLATQVFSVGRIPRVLHRCEKSLLSPHPVVQMLPDLRQPLRHIVTPSRSTNIPPRLLDDLPDEACGLRAGIRGRSGSRFST